MAKEHITRVPSKYRGAAAVISVTVISVVSFVTGATGGVIGKVVVGTLTTN